MLMQQAFATRPPLPPPEAIRGALLFGIVAAGLEAEPCEECAAQIAALKAALTSPVAIPAPGGPPLAARHVSADAAPAAPGK
jgi:hypothetical protein